MFLKYKTGLNHTDFQNDSRPPTSVFPASTSTPSTQWCCHAHQQWHHRSVHPHVLLLECHQQLWQNNLKMADKLDQHLDPVAPVINKEVLLLLMEHFKNLSVQNSTYQRDLTLENNAYQREFTNEKIEAVFVARL